MAVFVSAILSTVFGTAETGSFVFWLKQSLYTLFVGAVALVLLKVEGVPLKNTGIGTKPNAKLLVWSGIAVFFLINVMAIVNEYFSQLLVKIGCAEPSVNLPDNTAGQIIPYVICACILPAVCEEIAFRGVIAGGLYNSLGRFKSALVSGALFALFHMNAAQMLHQFVFGTILALVYFDSGSLISSMILHFFNNAVAVLLSYTVEPTGFYSKYEVVVLFVGAVMFAFCFWKYLRTAKQNTAKIEKCNENGTTVVQIDTKISISMLIFGLAICILTLVLGLIK